MEPLSRHDLRHKCTVRFVAILTLELLTLERVMTVRQSAAVDNVPNVGGGSRLLRRPV